MAKYPKIFSGVERKELISSVLFVLFLGGHESLERHAEDYLFALSTSLLLDYILRNLFSLDKTLI